MAQKVRSQNTRFAEHVKEAAIFPDSSILTNYAPFNLQSIKNSKFKVLGVGEQSHGTSEFFKARISVINSLAKSNNLTKIALEAPYAEVENLNAYILKGKGDLPQILKSFRLFNYECEEFVELVENVKQLNQSRKSPLTFFGIDMQTPFQALQNVGASCAANGTAASDSIKKLIEYYSLLSNEMYSHNFRKEDYAELSAMSENIFENISKDNAACLETPLIRKSLANYKQFLSLNKPEISSLIQGTIRDSLMAENVMSELSPGDKIIILAHNGHVQKTPNVYSKSMGYFLSGKLGTAYQCMALTTSTGFFTAFTPEAGKVTDKNLIPQAIAGTFEFEFSKIHKPILFFKTSVVKKMNADGALPEQYKLLPFGITDKPFVTGNMLDQDQM